MTLYVTAGTNLLTAILLDSSLEKLWGYVNVMQLLHFIPLFNLYFPIHVKILFSYIALFNMEIVLFSDAFKLLFDNEALSSHYVYGERFHDQGVSDGAILMGVADVLFVFLFHLLLFVVVLLLSRITKWMCCKKAYRAAKWGMFIALFIESYLSLSLGVMINLD